MNYSIDKKIFELFPQYCRGVVIGFNINNAQPDQEIADLLRQEIEGIALDPSINSSHPRLAVWADAYKQFGINPVRDTPSISFLVKHIKSGKSIRSISPVVDLFNTFSLRYRIPCGGDDLDAIGGDDIRLGLANGDEKFSPIFKPEIVESPRPGEVVYFTRRTKRILCRRWNWRNADFSKITPATRNLAVNLDGMIPLISRSELEEATEQLADSLRYHCGGAVFTKILDSYETSFDVLSGFGVEVS